MIASAFAAFFTGVTEPLEFAFMFVAPVLYLIHAVLTGVSVFIAASMHWIAGFGFSAGLVDLVLSTRNPLAVNWYMLLLQGLVFSSLYYFVFRTLIVKLNLNRITSYNVCYTKLLRWSCCWSRRPPRCSPCDSIVPAP